MRAPSLVLYAVLATTAACGDDRGRADARAADAAGGSDAGRAVDARVDASPGAVAVAITSPASGTVVVGSRTLRVTGTLAASTPITSVVVHSAGGLIAVTSDDHAFTATVTLADGDETITIDATAEDGATGSAQVTVRYPFVTLASFPAAARVLGQASATTGVARAADASSVHGPLGRVADAGGRLYVGASADHRVLGFDPFPAADNASAAFALGQASLAGSGAGSSASGFSQPDSVASDGTRLFVADHANNRVVAWTALPTTTGAAADFALGQPDLVSHAGACSATGLRGPIDVVVAGSKLIVADTNNNRVVIWSTIPTTLDVAPDLVLGQADFTHCTGNDDNQDGTSDGVASARTLGGPIGLWSDGTRLFVADTGNHRVLIWNTFPTASFTPADGVLGQTSFTATTGALGASTFVSPQFVDSNGNQLAVVDADGNRVLVWDTLPAAATDPDHVLGQADFTHGAANDDDQDGAKDGAPTARTLATPRGVTFVRDALYVSDNANQRGLFFGPLPAP